LKYRQKPSAQTVGPVHAFPPHWPYNGATVAVGVGVVLEELVLVLLGVELVELGLELGVPGLQ